MWEPLLSRTTEKQPPAVKQKEKPARAGKAACRLSISLGLENQGEDVGKFDFVAVFNRLSAFALNADPVQFGAVGAAAVFNVVLTIFTIETDVRPGDEGCLFRPQEGTEVFPAHDAAANCENHRLAIRRDKPGTSP